MKNIFLLSTLLLLLTSCQSALEKAARETTYSAYEWVGVEKRDLLKSRVKKARNEQKEAGEDFASALDRLKAITSFDGGSLERQYRSLQSSYDRSAEQAQAVRDSVHKVETVAGDLFEEWEKEIGEIGTPSMRDSSRKRLLETRKRYGEMITSLKGSSEKMDPVLAKLKDQVLYLKHNLNAQAIGSLKGESLRIQKEIESLVRDLEKSIASADGFIKQME